MSKKFRRTNKKGHQLWLNYCYGHPESTLLLCPYGGGVNYINHNKTLANVKIQWAPNGTAAHDSSWLSLTPKDIEWQIKPSLAFDYVATREIAEGEELFLDYGDLWEEAWVQHSKKWEPLDDWFSYVSAASWNEHTRHKPLRTEVELEDDPYPDSLAMKCHSALTPGGSVAEAFTWLGAENDSDDYAFDWPTDEYGYNCRILSRRQGESGWNYDVAIEASYVEDTWVEVKTRQQVPRKAIRFFDRPYTTDLHLPSAFRHELGIPDEMIPVTWRDRVLEDVVEPTKAVDYVQTSPNTGEAKEAPKKLPRVSTPKSSYFMNEL
jgi:hypothetical protein